ncbi:calcium-binding tyrosine phosphorylation-regulated protein [Lagopus leucura]|uniref:calcium-binding tyrosine phosphorylation-regulated protein n=1 Tax=Lagopus leucura TaxID=30410 RepID=UPI001C67F15B|nr:calcium-binding tyrosine phosphorylation-regulated protein [Lagopus leucura]
MEPPDNVLSCLKTLLEGVSRAVIKQKPEDIAGFLASYFQEFIDFQKENPDLVLTEVVEKFDLKQETWNGELEEKTSNHNEALLFTESQRKESCTDREEDDHLEDLTSRSSRVTLCPSPTSSVPESMHPTGPDRALSPEGSEVEYVPSEPAQLPAQVEDSGSVCLVRDVATTVQTLQEDVSAASAAEASRSQLGVQPWSSMSGELGPSNTQVLVLTTDTNQVSSVHLQEGLSSLPPPPPSKEELQAVPSCSAAKVISTIDKLIMDAEVPSYTQQFPDKIILSFSGQALSSVKLSLNAGQVSWLIANDAVFQPEQMEGIAPMEAAEQACCFRVECSIMDGMLKN